MTLKKAQTLGREIESAEKDAELYRGLRSHSMSEMSDVDLVKSPATNSKDKSCYRCERTDNANDKKCQARDAQFRKCRDTVPEVMATI